MSDPEKTPSASGVAAASTPRHYAHALQQHHHSRQQQQHHATPFSHDTPVVLDLGDDDDDLDDDDLDDDDLSVLDDDDAQKKLPYTKWRCIALVATVCGASFCNTLSVQSVVIILPSIGRDLSIPDSRLQWVVSAYALTFGCFLVLWGRIADVFGKKAIFVAGSAWVTATTVANPFVRNEIVFNLFRGLQGLGAAANVPTAIGILGTTFPPGKYKNYAFAAYGAGAPLGSIFGNLLSGIITTYASWQWVFGVLAILAGVVTVVGYLIIPSQPPPALVGCGSGSGSGSATSPSVARIPPRIRSIDWLGAFLLTLGLVGLLFALTEGNVVGWSTPWVGAIIGVSFLLMAAFVLWQVWLERPYNVQKKLAGRAWPPHPLVRMSIFSRARGGGGGGGGGLFAASLVIMALFFSSFNGFIVYATYFFQDYQGYDAIQTTLRFIPTGVAGVLTSLAAARLLSIVPTYLILLFGNVAVSISSLLMAVPIPAMRTSYFAYGMPAMIVSVMGADTAWPSLTLFVSHALPQEDQALGGALINMAGQVGRAIGLALATAIQTAVMAAHRGVDVAHVGPSQVHDDATLKGLRAGHWFNFSLGVVAFFVVLVTFRGSGIVGKEPEKPAAAAAAPPQRRQSQPVDSEKEPTPSSAAATQPLPVDCEKGIGATAHPSDAIGLAVSKD